MEDLSKLPIQTKRDVRAHTGEMISTSYKIEELEERSTSGSTSIPLKTYRSMEAGAYSTAISIRHLNWMGLRENVLTAYLAPPGLDKYPQQVIDPLRVYSFDLSVSKLENFVENIRRLKPPYLYGFPSPLNLFARFCEERGLNDISFVAIRTTGEKIYQDEKKRLNKVFATPVYELYSATDAGTIGCDCSEHTGLHICSENMLVEFLRDDEPAAPGEMASVVVTPLLNFGMPLIRYDLNDAARSIEDVCSCGRGLPLMSYVEGRQTDILVTQDGRFLANSTFHGRIFEKIDVLQYRLIQDGLLDVVVEVVPGRSFRVKDERFIIESLKMYLGSHVSVTVRITEEIKASASGKRRVVESRVPITL